jgi:sarcosine/dimethylglycine N-methyltransferase
VEEVLDAATGTGYHSVRLLESGFEVVSADGSPQMLAKAFENGLERGHILRVVQADWRWLNRDVHGEYDAIICLGNSFTHLFSERDRRKTLAEFYAMLKHDGVLILDHRNYDSILDLGFSSKHTYYYVGEDVSAEPEHVDEGLARFRYWFSDDSVYYLNMYPLRKEYVRRLMREVGFQRIDTYGDFQETYGEKEPDFFIHIAEKLYREEEEDLTENYSEVVHTARDYYNSEDADNFYFNIWGGEDIHVGTYNYPGESIFDASRRTVERMAEKLDITPETRILDIGAGYGGSARYLAREYGCPVVALNLSEVENDRDRQKNVEQGLDHLIEVVDASFEDLPYPDNSFDIVWSQDAMLHSGDRTRVLEEVNRVLKPGGDFIFTDPMATDGASKDVLQPILERLHLDTLGSPGFYRREMQRLGLREVEFDDNSPQLPEHYGRVLKELQSRENDLGDKVSDEYIERMKKGLNHWVEGGNSGHMAWGIFHFRS